MRQTFESQKTDAQIEAEVERAKRDFPGGTLVKYWRGVKEGAPSGEGRVYALGLLGGTVCVWIEGCIGGVAVSHVERVGAQEIAVTVAELRDGKRFRWQESTDGARFRVTLLRREIQ